MADAEAVILGLNQEIQQGKQISGLVLNQKGLDRALATNLPQIDLSLSIDSLHSTRNTGLSREASLDSLKQMIAIAKTQNRKVRVGLNTVFGLKVGKEPDWNFLQTVLQQLSTESFELISLADTSGIANPVSIKRAVRMVQNLCPNPQLILHLHDTHGRGLLNLHTAWTLGVRHFDVALGGLGGCPFLPGAKGNLATDTVLDLFESMGSQFNLDRELLASTRDSLLQNLRPDPNFPNQVTSRKTGSSHGTDIGGKNPQPQIG